jgi:Zn-dependent protease
MSPTREGSFRLFRLLGIDVHVHWSWFFVALYSISNRVPNYSSPLWGALEYLALFLVVLLHEFGHALACRQVGGKADQIVLWPLGGVAYVSPPQRPGATLWTIAAGPLVNVALLPLLWGLLYAEHRLWVENPDPDRHRFFRYLLMMDFWLLCFNLLPIYPLDGGQILRSLLWFPLGKARSLMASTGVGFLGGAALIGLAMWGRSIWIGLMAIYLLSICWKSFQQAKALRRLERLPRRPEFACPSCRTAPPVGNYWLCPQCQQAYDPFATASVCPHCHGVLERITCPDCGDARAQRAWDITVREA